MEKMITISSGFQYSVNIGYDLYNDEKLKNFIPTKASLHLLEEILLSTDDISTERARILIGAYGKGKSHIVLTILAMLMKRDIQLFEKLLPKLSENIKLKKIIENYYKSNKKLLPVVITGSNTSMTQAFLLGLQNTLKDNGLMKIMPKTNYQAAVNCITKWKKEYPHVYGQFCEEIAEPIDIFLNKLEDFNIVAYETFEKIYPSLTAGSSFNPFLGFDVVSLYEEVVKAIEPYGYTGIYVVYDEFSKYLEANITEATVSDTKTLQDFAEKCNRSGKNQLHLMLISHKEIANYIDKLPKEKTDGWRGVSERFKHIHLSNNFRQTYEIIASVIRKNPKIWAQFIESNKAKFDELSHKYKGHVLFTDVTDFTNFIEETYPLHPVSTYILPRLSERVAQNERTLFTFLSANTEATLPAFLENYNENDFQLITPDLIYDYFEPLFKKEVYEGQMHKMYVLTSRILEQLDKNSLEAKIVKTISLIYILEQTEILRPTESEVCDIFSPDYSKDEVINAIKNLINNAFVIYLKRSNKFLKLKESSGVDIAQAIHDTIDKQKKSFSLKDILNERNNDKALYPARYNDSHEMTRYFSFEFINADEVNENTNWDIKAEQYDGDGLIFAILPDQTTDLEMLKEQLIRSTRLYNRYVFIVPHRYSNIDQPVRQLNAVSTLRQDSIEDPILFDEYDLVYDDLNEIVNKFISGYTHPEKYLSTYISNGEIKKINRKSALSSLLSDICNVVYSHTPIIINESINKNVITKAAFNSRNKVISALLQNDLEINLGFTGHGQEVTIMRNTLINTGLLVENDNRLIIDLQTNNVSRIRNVTDEIVNFIHNAQDDAKGLKELYDILIGPNHHIGLRRGVIPIYLAAVFHEYKKEVILYNDTVQMPLNLDTLLKIDAHPENYSLSCIEWNDDKEAYMHALENLFSEYVIDAEKERDSYAYITNAMTRWYMGLPKYSKELRKSIDGIRVRKSYRQFLRAVKENRGSQCLLFADIPNIFNLENVYDKNLLEQLQNVKSFYDSAIINLVDYLLSFMKNQFMSSNKNHLIDHMSLTSIIRDWMESLDENIFLQAFDDGTDLFLKKCQSITNNEEAFVKSIAKFTTDLRIEDWNDNTRTKFEERVLYFKNKAESFRAVNNNAEEQIVNNYQLTYIDANGNTITKRFDKTDETGRGKLLKRALTSQLDSMGQAVSQQEKRQILMDILEKMF